MAQKVQNENRQVRLRMAPSPTGEYHIGHIRTVLYNIAYAKKHHGKFILRIEDTDRNRFVEGATEKIMNIIKDYGFSWDEGPGVGGDYGPYVQSERLELYRKYAEELVRKGYAYYCFCSKERLANLRKEQQAKKLPVTKYDKKCLGLLPGEVQARLEAGEEHVIRLNVPPHQDISFEDAVFGKITINTDSMDDQILLKSDGYPSYHLAVVIDDHLMGITHVMRGNDWIPSTPKHLLLYKAFGWEPPVYIHLPNIKEKGGSKKLSKRFGSVFAREFLEEGYLPEALVNFLMFLGWNPGTEREIYSFDDFVKDFSVERIHNTDLVAFDRDKLIWMNGQYIRNMDTFDLWQRIQQWAEKFGKKIFVGDKSTGYIVAVLALVQGRMRLLGDFSDLAEYFFSEPQIDETLLYKFAEEDRAKRILASFSASFGGVVEKEWSAEGLKEVCGEVLKSEGYSPKEAYMTLRVALTGRKASPHIFDVLDVLGKSQVMERLSVLLGISQ